MTLRGAMAMAGLFCMSLSSPAAAFAESVSPLAAIVDVPKGQGPFPVVVYANGQGGNSRSALPETMARAMVLRGIAVVRFDWRHRPADPASNQARDLVSKDLQEEIADYQAALAIVRKDARFRGDSVALMGKSLGSVVAARILASWPEIVGAVLLTPICSRAAKPADPDWLRNPYPGLATETRPIAFVSGDGDPLCDPKALYRLAGSMTGPVRIDIVDGDHGFGRKDRPEDFGLASENATAAALWMLQKGRR